MTDLRARPVALIPASIGRRIGAYTIDLGVAAAIPAVLGLIGFGIILAVGPAWERESLAMMILWTYILISLVSFAWLFVYTAMQGGRGSIGQRALGLQLRDAAGSGLIGFWRALLRNIVWWLAGSIVVGYFSPLFDSSPKHQGWHDMAARAIVVDRVATDAAAADPGTSLPEPTANPYLPPPAGSPFPRSGAAAVPITLPTAPPALRPSAAPGRFAPVSSSGGGSPAGGGLISSVPGVSAGVAARTAVGVGAAAAADTLAAAPAALSVAPPASAAGSPAVSPASEDVDATRAGASVAQPLVSLTWDDGTHVAVFGHTLFGRNPAAEAGAVVVPVRDETLSLSKTHFEIDGDSSGAWVIDRHSTNGTVLVRDGERETLTPAARTMLRPGDRLEFGDRSLTVGGAS